jgi:hypothetical protein
MSLAPLAAAVAIAAQVSPVIRNAMPMRLPPNPIRFDAVVRSGNWAERTTRGPAIAAGIRRRGRLPLTPHIAMVQGISSVTCLRWSPDDRLETPGESQTLDGGAASVVRGRSTTVDRSESEGTRSWALRRWPVFSWMQPRCRPYVTKSWSVPHRAAH